MALVLLPATASAADDIWKGTTSANWGTGTNWSLGTAPGTGDVARFDNQSTANLNITACAPGDLNSDKNFDAADYVYWRKTNGSAADYDAWRANFGNPPGAGSGLGAGAVPEPTTLLLSLLMIGSTFIAGRRKR